MTLLIKASTETRTSSGSLLVDSDLATTLAANTWYEWESICAVYSGATPDFKFRYNFSGSIIWADGSLTFQNACLAGTWVGQGTTFTQQRFITPGELTDGTTTNFIAGDATTTFRALIWARGYIRVGTSGTLALYWAQNTSNGANTQVLVNSWLYVKAQETAAP